MIRHTLLALALIGAAGVANAQTAVDPMVGLVRRRSPARATTTRERPGLQPMDQQAQAQFRPIAARASMRRLSATNTASATTTAATASMRSGRRISPHTTTP